MHFVKQNTTIINFFETKIVLKQKFQQHTLRKIASSTVALGKQIPTCRRIKRNDNKSLNLTQEILPKRGKHINKRLKTNRGK